MASSCGAVPRDGRGGTLRGLRKEEEDATKATATVPLSSCRSGDPARAPSSGVIPVQVGVVHASGHSRTMGSTANPCRRRRRRRVWRLWNSSSSSGSSVANRSRGSAKGATATMRRASAPSAGSSTTCAIRRRSTAQLLRLKRKAVWWSRMPFSTTSSRRVEPPTQIPLAPAAVEAQPAPRREVVQRQQRPQNSGVVYPAAKTATVATLAGRARRVE